MDVDGQSFRISYYSDRFDEQPDTWFLGFRNFAAFPYDATIDSKTTGGFLIYREGTISAPIHPPGFERIDNGLSTFYPSAREMQNYNGEIVAVIDERLRRFNSQTSTWEIMKDDFDAWGIKLGSEVIHNLEEYSLDGGYTWKSMPHLEGSNLEGNAVALGTTLYASSRIDLEEYSLDGGYTWKSMPNLEGSDHPGNNLEGNAVALGTTLYSSSRIDVEDSPTSRQIWNVDLNASTPTWSKVSEMPANDYSSRELLAITPANTLVRSAWLEQGGIELEISSDLGLTFSALESNCSQYPKAHADGIYCKVENGSVQWYSLATNTWSTIAVSNDDWLVEPSRLRDALYIVRNGNTLLKVSADGNETTLTPLGDETSSSGRVYILDEHIVFNKLTLWLKSL